MFPSRERSFEPSGIEEGFYQEKHSLLPLQSDTVYGTTYFQAYFQEGGKALQQASD